MSEGAVSAEKIQTAIALRHSDGSFVNINRSGEKTPIKPTFTESIPINSVLKIAKSYFEVVKPKSEDYKNFGDAIFVRKINNNEFNKLRNEHRKVYDVDKNNVPLSQKSVSELSLSQQTKAGKDKKGQPFRNIVAGKPAR